MGKGLDTACGADTDYLMGDNMGNINHDERGRFASAPSGASVGDHAAESPNKDVRNVPGHGPIERSRPVARHADQDSVGTGPRLSEAARWGVTKGKGIDQRHYGIEGADRTGKTDLGKPAVTLGPELVKTLKKFDTRAMKARA